jgi:hypothetical protein
VGKSDQSFTGEILHFNATRLRVTGAGVLRTKFSSLNDVNQLDSPNLTMLTVTNIEPTLLTNFRDQRGRYEGTTTDIDETFNISKMIVYIKPIATGYPQ